MSTALTNHFKNRLFSILMVITILLCQLVLNPQSIQAQSNGPELILGELDKTEFPTIQLDFTIRHARPSQLAPLKPGDVTILEGESQLPVTKLENEYTGTHFMLAINNARALALVDQFRVTNYEKMIQAIKTLGSSIAPEGGNHFSLFVNPESQWQELGNYSAWLNAIDEYEDVYGMRRLEPDFASLEMALDSYQNSELEQDTVLLYIVPYLYAPDLARFYELIERANQLALPVHTWFVMGDRESSVPYQDDLRDALVLGGGSLFIFSGSEELPDPKSYIEGMGYHYSVEYKSALLSTQAVNVAIQLETSGLGKLQSDSKNLSVVVEPAHLRFLNAVSELPVLLDDVGNPTPKELPLEVSIEFLDNYPREIVATSLWIDGKKLQENKTPPYGSFVLDLSPYVESTTLSLEAKLDDIWGLQGSTGTRRLKLEISKPETFIEEITQGPNRWIILGIGMGILILAFVFLFPVMRQNRATRVIGTTDNPLSKENADSGKTKRKTRRSRKDKARSNKKEKQTENGESEQSEAPSPQSLQEIAIHPARHFGSLLKLDKDGTPSATKPFLLTKSVVYIGRDPKLADLVLDDSAIEPLHAELQLFDDGRVTITDFKTTAGTYRNYKALTANATELQHGDILHFGTVMYRLHSATRTISPDIATETSPEETPEP